MFDKNSNAYHVFYMAVMTTIVAVLLSVLAVSLKPTQDYNVKIASMTDILKAVGKDGEADIEAFFNANIQGLVLDHEGNEIESDVDAVDIDIKKESKLANEERRFPLFLFKNEQGKTNYIIPLRGFGLWDEIWGFVALEEDGNTIAGVAFDHKGETPGLGAEIKDKKDWGESFIGKKIFNAAGDYVSVGVLKGNISAADADHMVSSISGATITSSGVNDMLSEDINDYLAYIQKKK